MITLLLLSLILPTDKIETHSGLVVKTVQTKTHDMDITNGKPIYTTAETLSITLRSWDGSSWVGDPRTFTVAPTVPVRRPPHDSTIASNLWINLAVGKSVCLKTRNGVVTEVQLQSHSR
jgi:hypothetical protein